MTKKQDELNKTVKFGAPLNELDTEEQGITRDNCSEKEFLLALCRIYQEALRDSIIISSDDKAEADVAIGYFQENYGNAAGIDVCQFLSTIE